MPVDLVLKDARILAYGKVVDAGLAIDGERIVKIAKEPNLPEASREMSLKGLLVLPGLIDVHVHLRDQELKYKEDFFSGTAAAAAGGVTLTIDMPNNKPVTMNLDSLRKRMSEAAEKIIVNVAFYSAFPEKVEEMYSIVQGGAKAFKLFMSQKIGGIDPNNDDDLLKAFREAAKLNVPVSVHAEDMGFLENACTKLKQKGDNSIDSYLKVHSSEAEVKAINRTVELIKGSNAHVHICHLSTREGINIISSAKRRMLPITCEVTPHHLFLSSRDMKDAGTTALTNPPLRSKRDNRSLRSALKRGLIDILVSDHAPHAVKEKKSASIWEVAAGIPGLETLLPLMLSQVNRGCLSLSKLVRMTSEKPAAIFGIKERGFLEKGNYADLVVVDLKEEWRIDSSKFYSKAKYSPFEGWQVKGKPVKTFVNGSLVMDEGEIIAKPGTGRVIT